MINQNIEDIYLNILNNLSLNEQISLAALLLDNISQKNLTIVDVSDNWTEEDMNDITSFSLNYIENYISEDEEEII